MAKDFEKEEEIKETPKYEPKKDLKKQFKENRLLAINNMTNKALAKKQARRLLRKGDK